MITNLRICSSGVYPNKGNINYYLCSVKLNHGTMKRYIFPVAVAYTLFFASCSQNETEDLPGILINGVRWAPTNVAAPGAFATSALEDGMFYQWGRRTGWWNAVDSLPPVSSPAGEVWNDTPAAGDRWATSADPCPEGWRLPTQKDFEKLLDSEKVSFRGTADDLGDGGGGGIPDWNSRADMKLSRETRSMGDPFDRDGLKRRDEYSAAAQGIVFTDRRSGEQLFLPVAGMRYRDAGRLQNRDTDGFYWFLWEGGDIPNNLNIETDGCYFWFCVETVNDPPKTLAYTARAEGFSVRCVLK
jgi:uncharacterized protein (TIGR02145 family)